MWNTPRVRTLAFVLLLGCASVACASRPPAPPPEPVEEVSGATFGERAVEFSGDAARVVAKGAVATGKGMATAYRGMRDGFQAPEAEDGYGRYPKNYLHLVKRHFVRILHYPDNARFAFGRPVRGYMNKGIFQGGGVAWQGWLVDVKVETDRWGDEERSETFVVRLHEGEVVDVHGSPELLHRVE